MTIPQFGSAGLLQPLTSQAKADQKDRVVPLRVKNP
jgi:hypothetical protein